MPVHRGARQRMTQGERRTRGMRGRLGEWFARWWLRLHGFRIVQRNFTIRGGEIDIIASRRDLLLFVEVRVRLGASHGSALASVDQGKQQRLIRTSQVFQLRFSSYRQHRCRFDVISFSRPNYAPRLQWTRNAFREEATPTSSTVPVDSLAHRLRLQQ